MNETSEIIQQLVTSALKSNPMMMQLPKNVRKMRTFDVRRFISAGKEQKVENQHSTKDFNASKRLQFAVETSQTHHILFYVIYDEY